MAFYVIVTQAIEFPTPSAVRIHFELRDDSTDPDTVVLSGTTQLQVNREDDKDQADKTLTTEERIQRLIDDFTDWALDLIKRKKALDVDRTGISSAFNGLTIMG